MQHLRCGQAWLSVTIGAPVPPCCGNRRAGREHGFARAIPHSRQARSATLAFFESVLFALIEEIGLRTAQVDDFRAAVAVLLLHRALFAVERIRHAHSPADNASSFVRAVVALVANPNHRARPERRTQVRIRRGITRARARATLATVNGAARPAGRTPPRRGQQQWEASRARPDIGVADDALAVALFAEAPNRDAWLLAAHDQVGVVLRHLAVSSCPCGEPVAALCVVDPAGGSAHSSPTHLQAPPPLGASRRDPRDQD